MKTFRVAVVSKETGKAVIHKIQGSVHTTHNHGGYNELHIGDEQGNVIARFINWAWIKEVKTP